MVFFLHTIIYSFFFQDKNVAREVLKHMCVFFHASANDDIKEVIIILFQLDYKLVPKMRLLLKF